MSPSSSQSKGGRPQSSSTANRSQATGSWARLMRWDTSEFQTRNRVLQSPSVTSYDSQATGSWAPSSWSGTSEFQTRNLVSQSPSVTSSITSHNSQYTGSLARLIRSGTNEFQTRNPVSQSPSVLMQSGTSEFQTRGRDSQLSSTAQAISRVSASSSASAAQQAGVTTSSRVSTADGFRERRCDTRAGAEESEERSLVLRYSTAQGESRVSSASSPTIYMMGEREREMARALYDRGGEREKREAGRFFDALDSNEDGKVCLREFQKSKVVGYSLSNDGVFEELRLNSDGTMSFDDVLVLFYIKKGVITILTCDECDELISGPSFPSNSGSICWLCYGRGNSIYRPRSAQTPVNLSLVKYTKPVTNEKEEMKKLRKIAELHYSTASPRMRRLADEFFDSIYRDRYYGKVKIKDFQSFMLQKGYRQLQNSQLFDDLDVGRTGTLGFSEVMTLYYIIKSGRPHCDRCKVFIPGVFFTCVRCFKKGNSFNLCSKCYEAVDGNYHVHNSVAQFLDNYTLLQTVRESSSLPRRQYRDRHDHDPDDDQRWDDKPSSPTPIVPEAPKQNSRIGLMDLAFKGLELGIAICKAYATRLET